MESKRKSEKIIKKLLTNDVTSDIIKKLSLRQQKINYKR